MGGLKATYKLGNSGGKRSRTLSGGRRGSNTTEDPARIASENDPLPNRLRSVGVSLSATPPRDIKTSADIFVFTGSARFDQESTSQGESEATRAVEGYAPIGRHGVLDTSGSAARPERAPSTPTIDPAFEVRRRPQSAATSRLSSAERRQRREELRHFHERNMAGSNARWAAEAERRRLERTRQYSDSNSGGGAADRHSQNGDDCS